MFIIGGKSEYKREVLNLHCELDQVCIAVSVRVSLGFGLWVCIGLPYCNSGPYGTGMSEITVPVPVL